MTLEEIVDSLKRTGWCVIPDVIPEDEVDGVRAAVYGEIERQRDGWEEEAARIERSGHQPPPAKIGHAQALINELPELLGPLVAHPVLMEACEALLGPRFRISSVGAITTYPGNERGHWHADWPYNGTLATCLPVPYPDALINLSAIFMLTEFTRETGGTLIVPGSHRKLDNPSTGNGVDRLAPLPSETQVEGRAGSVLFYDSRLWHAVAPNRSPRPRTIVTVRYTPWWINLEVRRPGAPDYLRTRAEANGKDNSWPLLPRPVFDRLGAAAQPLFLHWVESAPSLPAGRSAQ